MRTGITLILFATLVGGVLCSFFPVPLVVLTEYIEAHAFFGGFIFASALIVSTVVAPVAALPLVPITAPILGPALTGGIAVISWTIGGTIAFLLARHGGRPFLEKYRSIQLLARYESRLSRRAHFMLLIALRMMIPVDVLSYALGFVSTVTLREFVITTVLGVSWFAFAFAYFGEALFTRNYVLLTGIGVASVAILLGCRLYIKSHTNKGPSGDIS